MTPEELLYTNEHEWVRVDGEELTIGITFHAQEELGDVVYVELPEVGQSFEAKAAFGTVESVKAVSELFMPVSGEVIGVNEALGDSPEKVNEDPYGDGWMLRVRAADVGQLKDLLSAEAYASFISGSEG
jgi:glycine cleavage system H protein